MGNRAELAWMGGLVEYLELMAVRVGQSVVRRVKYERMTYDT